MKLYEINTPLNGQKNYAISGFTINGCKEYSQPRLILEIEDEQETKLPKIKQETQQTPAYCHMIKSYANALKGNIHDEKEISEENDMIEILSLFVNQRTTFRQMKFIATF